MTPLRRRLSASTFLLALQFGGGLLLCLGAERNIAIYASGILLLLPGSLIAMEIPVHLIGATHLLASHGVDGWDIQNIAYLPISILLNCICFLAIRRFLPARPHPND
jgi:hypothetical protein